ncbi:hypothetical protein RS130_00105 [Paraglaciecola aquimarina]|uniref:Uncharacterized protein n=1 Tax=Paraglaciecola aquimarina TaxID=1235557 RepID=A0ABU3SR96_9ALTE|nr:hypothetical protein [Paraglaciecola aquimarina]MDU0352516.1 hypothetical protein [Paraglaciecola aquimarina]
MRKCLILCFMFFSSLGFAEQNTDTPTSGGLVYSALEDFRIMAEGLAPYYRDLRYNALAIDARVHDYRNLFAQASVQFSGQPGDYDITLTSLTEEDGEPIYRLLVNDEVVGMYRGSYIGKDSPKDLKLEKHTWKGITLKPGDKLSVGSIADTNGEIPEYGGTAWAKGRWQQIELKQAEDLPAPRPRFNYDNDLLVAQFDLLPDADDVHAIAALGSMLQHSDLQKVDYIAVAGTTGIQKGTYVNANTLFNMAFGQQNLYWTDARADWQKSVLMIRDRVKARLANGGKIWVQEAGQSDFTRDWVEGLIDVGVHPSVVKNNVIVVQHSSWNEEKTTAEDLSFIKKLTDYRAINDGNKALKKYIRKNRRGEFTPQYVDLDLKWIKTAVSTSNDNEDIRKLWIEADKLIKSSGFSAKYSVIPKGGVDFSDLVETWWTLELGQPAISVHAFWQRYVTNVELDSIHAPKGRLAVVIDGNSPDPDDIGATPVMFGLLKKSGLRDRLVHLSHSCDLDPTRNKGYQIGKEDELRRQKILHEMSGKGIELFGPFANLAKYYNCRADQNGAIADLVKAINASTEADPLWIIEAGEPDLIGYALQQSDPKVHKNVHVVSHHPANDDSGDFFTWQQILDFGVREHQIGDQNLGLQTPMEPWDWAKNHHDPAMKYIWDMLAYAEQDGVVPFQTNKFDCSDAGMIYWWITGADKGEINTQPLPT